MARFKRRAPRRKMNRRRKFRRATKLVNHALSPIPQRYITKMKYSEVITTTGTNAQYAMNLNSIFDPNRTGSGHKPYGFTTLQLLYGRYRVIACGYRIQLAMGATTVPVILTAIPANQVLTATTASEIRENPRSRYITQNPGSSAVTLSGKAYIPSIVGRSKPQYMADDRYQATTSTDPAEVVCLSLQTFSGSDAPLTGVQVQVLMEYTVEFFDVISQGQSV